MPKKTALEKKDNLKADLYNLKGEVTGKINLPAEIFAAGVNSLLLAQAVRVYLANQRMGTHSTKTRSEVVGSTKKIYRQKGTGRARHGDIKAPIFIGGGRAHGPKPRDYSLNLSKKMRRIALFGALTNKFREGKLCILQGLKDVPAKTKEMALIFANLHLLQDKRKKNSTLLVLSDYLQNVILAGRNIKNLTLENVRLLNAYEIMSEQNILMMEEAIPVLEANFLGKGKKEKQPEVSKGIKKKKQKVKPVPAKKSLTKSKKKIKK